MQGKILSNNVIRGDDGKRYTYQPNDIKGSSTPPLR